MSEKVNLTARKPRVDWKAHGYRDFKSFSKDWKDFYPSLKDFYDTEFDSTFFEFTTNEYTIDPSESDEDIEKYDAPRQRQEWMRCAENFFYFCHKFVKIAHPKQGLIPFRLYKYQRRVINEYDKHQYNIISKFRQGGLTTQTVLWGLWRAMFRLDEQMMLVSKTDREAITAGEIASRAMEHFPTWLKPRMGKSTDHQRHFMDTDSWLNFYTPEAARGKAITYLFVDEAAFIPDMDRHWKSLYPTLSTGGNCIAISTVNGVGNWYEYTYKRAALPPGHKRKNEFFVIDLDYWEHPDYSDEEWVRKTKANLGPKGWRQEVLRDFLGSGETYFSHDTIERLTAIVEDNNPIRKIFPAYANREDDIDVFMDDDFEQGALWVWREPVDGHDYIIGVDCSEGVGEDGDNACFQILDVNTCEQVAEFYSNNTPPHIFAQILNEVGIMYNTGLVVVENAGPAGGAVIAALEHKLYYENLYFDMSKRTRATKAGVSVNQQNRPVVLEHLQHRFLDETLKINSERFVREVNTFLFNPQRKRAEAQVGRHDDAIIALALALHAHENMNRGLPVGAELPKEITSTFKTSVYEAIKAELHRGAPEDYLAEDSEYDALMPNPSEILPGVIFNHRRKYDKLLKEFGW
tara:strand:- start:2595 stop:4490 length:1896 start_codon:yes stop_codon:yes gene_type:complete